MIFLLNKGIGSALADAGSSGKGGGDAEKVLRGHDNMPPSNDGSNSASSQEECLYQGWRGGGVSSINKLCRSLLF